MADATTTVAALKQNMRRFAAARGWDPYHTPKNLTLCLAKTLGPKIRVNAIAPGFVAETRWNEGRPNLEAAQQAAGNAALLKRVGYPADIAEAAVFLGGAGSYMTGHVMVVDGGRIWA